MLFDCFTFFNELDILEIRLHELAPVVDRFVLVEAKQTFQGAQKPLFFADNLPRFRAFSERIIHVVVEFPQNITLPYRVGTPYRRRAVHWQREFFQRDAIERGLKGAFGDDLVLISDVDEIPAAQALASAVRNRRPSDLTVFAMGNYSGFLNLRSRAQPTWFGPKMVERRLLTTAEGLRSTRPKFNARRRWDTPYGRLRARVWNAAHRGYFGRVVPILDAGWHFSSIGSFEAITAKKMACAHPELLPDHLRLGPEGLLAKIVSQSEEVPLSELPQFVQLNSTRLPMRSGDGPPHQAPMG